MINVVVCVKVVSANLIGRKEKVDEIYGLNPYDMYALNKVIELKKKVPCKITCLCMGKEDVKDVLVHCKAMGVDEAILLSDRLFSGSDTYATTYTLALAIKKLNYDLIVCGCEAVDGETGQVPYSLAQRLELTCIPNVEDIDTIMDQEIQVRYEDGEYMNTVAGKLPLVIIFKNFTTKTGKINLLKLKRAQSSPIIVWSAKDIEAEPDLLGQVGSKTKVCHAVNISNKKREISYIEGSSSEVSNWLEKVIQEN